MRRSSMKISVVIPSYNSAETIRTCLGAVMNQTEPATDVMVVDSSDDQTPEIVRMGFPGIRLVHLDERTLPGPARNIGVENTESELVAFTDTDCEPSPEWLARLHEGLTDDVVGCAGVIAGPRNETIPAFVDRVVCFGEFLPGARPRLVRAAPTANIMLRRQAILAAGGFPKDMFPGEDLLLCRRVTESGQMIRICPHARTVHHSPDDWGSVEHRQYRYGQMFVRSRQEDRTAAGSVLIRAPLGIGLAAAIRYVRVVSRLVARDEVSLRRCFSAQPMLLRAMLAWARGALDARNRQETNADVACDDVRAEEKKHDANPAGE